MSVIHLDDIVSTLDTLGDIVGRIDTWEIGKDVRLQILNLIVLERNSCKLCQKSSRLICLVMMSVMTTQHVR